MKVITINGINYSKEEYDNFIIKPDDIRFGKLESIYSRYSYDKLLVYKGDELYYLLPHELVVHPYITRTKFVISDTVDTLIYNKGFWSILEFSTDLTQQELFDICVLHINLKSDRPKCDYCGNPLEFFTLRYGYSKSKIIWEEKHNLTCSLNCANALDQRHISRMQYVGFLNQGNLSDVCSLYLVYDSNLIKFGVTSNFDRRLAQLNSEFNNPSSKVLFTGTRFQVANIESRLKNQFESEWVEYSEVNLDLIYSIVSGSNSKTPLFNVTIDNLKSSLPIVHLMRGGAPDKAMFYYLPAFNLIKHDFTNLVSYSKSEIYSILRNNEWILPADEGDIKHANKIYDPNELVDQSHILLPQIQLPDDSYKVIDYDKFVPKDSQVYANLELKTGIIYPRYNSLSLSEFINNWTLDDLNNLKGGIALKSTTGSGSRGVWLIDEDRVSLGGKYTDKLTDIQYNNFIEFCKKENCNILIQSLIPNKPGKLLKCNTDFIIRDGKLLSYKWDLVNQAQQFTNWDNFNVIRSEYTDKVMNNLVNYLVNDCGICNGILNFESFSDLKSETYMIEINWRLSNSIFEYQALGVDAVTIYLENNNFEVPYGSHQAIRYWQCAFKDNIDGYHNGK